MEVGQRVMVGDGVRDCVNVGRGVLVRVTDVGDEAANQAAETYRSGRARVLARLGGREAEEIQYDPSVHGSR